MKRLLYKSPCVTVTEVEPSGIFCVSARPKSWVDESEHINEENHDEEERVLWGVFN